MNARETSLGRRLFRCRPWPSRGGTGRALFAFMLGMVFGTIFPRLWLGPLIQKDLAVHEEGHELGDCGRTGSETRQRPEKNREEYQPSWHYSLDGDPQSRRGVKMAGSSSGRVFRQVERLFNLGAVGTMTDAQLLDWFVSGRGEPSEAAFEELVNRHGPMVFRVCRSVLRDTHDAEDAFQATFLVLAHRARSIRRRGSIASWLFGVAHRVASRQERCCPSSRSRNSNRKQEGGKLCLGGGK